MLDRAQQLRGYRLNAMAMGLGEPANRRAFVTDERAYLRRHDLTPEEVEAVTSRDWKRMIALGGNLFFILKISAVDPVAVTAIGAAQVDMEHATFLRERLGKKD